MAFSNRKVDLEAVLIVICFALLFIGLVFVFSLQVNRDNDERETYKQFMQKCVSMKANEGMDLVKAEEECLVIWRWK